MLDVKHGKTKPLESVQSHFGSNLHLVCFGMFSPDVLSKDLLSVAAEK